MAYSMGGSRGGIPPSQRSRKFHNGRRAGERDGTQKEMLKKLLVQNFGSLSEFTMTNVRSFCEAKMEEAYPNNSTMSRTIARNLQELRDDGVIIFVAGKRGTYRWSKKKEEDVAVKPDASLVAKLVEIGLPENGSKRAAIACGNSSMDACMMWIVEHQKTPINDPLEEEVKHETSPRSVSDEDLEPWPEVNNECEEMSAISKDMMWKMCQEQYKMIETLKEANASLTKEVDDLKKKDRERLLMVAKARQVAQKALVSSASDEECDETTQKLKKRIKDFS